MYTSPYFVESRTEELHRIIVEHPFATLVVNGAEGPDACHLPFEFDAQAGNQGTLRAHIARDNPLWHEYGEGTPVLVIFQGADSYISPNGYPSKHEFRGTADSDRRHRNSNRAHCGYLQAQPEQGRARSRECRPGIVQASAGRAQ